METKIYKILSTENKQNEIAEAGELLRSGEVVAIPTETVYGLAANAFDGQAVAKIFRAKGRPQDNPLIVHIAQFDEIYGIAREVPESVKALAEKYWPGPLTVILPKKDTIPVEVSAGLDTVAIRMPSHPVARAIIKAAGVPLAAPSANISGFPSPTSVQHVEDDMTGRIAAIVDGGECEFGIESTVLTLATPVPRLLRPGAVTAEQLKEVLGEVQIDEAVLNPLAKDAVAASPGMKYKHYSPKAQIYIVRGGKEEFFSYLENHKGEADHVLIFEGEEDMTCLPFVTFGKEDEPLTQSHRLFVALRELDDDGAKTVFARCPSEKGVGLGVCNRLYRAAAFRFLSDKKGKIIGITGASGSGKSTICETLASKGAVIIDADKEARAVTAKGSPQLKELADIFGEDIILENGELDRRKLAGRAFASEENNKKLISVTHPAIINICRNKARQAADEGKNAVIDAPLLFSSGLDKICDVTVRVTAPEEVRLQRIMARDGITKEEAMKRFSAQTKEAELAGAADIEIVNDMDTDPVKEAEKLLTVGL